MPGERIRLPQLDGGRKRSVDGIIRAISCGGARTLPQILVSNAAEPTVDGSGVKTEGDSVPSLPVFKDSLRKDAIINCIGRRIGIRPRMRGQSPMPELIDIAPDFIITGQAMELNKENSDSSLVLSERTSRALSSQNEDEELLGHSQVSSKEVYLAACRRLRVVASRQISEQLSESLLPLNYLNLAAPGIAALSVALVDISENKLELEGAKTIAKLLARNRTLITLNLSGNNFKDAGVRYIAHALKKNRGLRTLLLSHNHIDEQGAAALGEALTENDYLQNLSLRWNHLRLKGAVVFIRSLEENSSLKMLDLSWNGLSDTGARAIGQYLADNDSLEVIDLTANRIHVEGAMSLSKGIKKNSTLRILKLSQNPIASKGACLILEAIKVNVDSNIRRFDIMDIEINAQFEAMLVEVRTRRELEVAHGGLVTDDPYGQPARKTPATMGDPASLLFNYVKSSGLRLIDLFAQLDSDNSSSVSHDEFKLGMKRSGLPLSDLQVEKLIHHLDVDGDGEIDFKELVEGQRSFRDRERQRRRAASPNQMSVEMTTPASERTAYSSANDGHAPTPRVASPRLAMDSPLGKSTLIYARRDSTSYQRASTQLTPTWEDEDFSPR